MTYVYLSYGPADAPYTLKLVSRLLEEGFDIWLDNRQDTSEERWDALEKAIHDSSAVVLVMSSSAPEYPWVMREVSTAVSSKKPLFPLLIEGKIWTLMRGRPVEEIENQAVPAEAFFNRLSEVIPRHPRRGTNLTPSDSAGSEDAAPEATALSKPKALRDLTSILRASMNKPGGEN